MDSQIRGKIVPLCLLFVLSFVRGANQIPPSNQWDFAGSYSILCRFIVSLERARSFLFPVALPSQLRQPCTVHSNRRSHSRFRLSVETIRQIFASWRNSCETHRRTVADLCGNEQCWE